MVMVMLSRGKSPDYNALVFREVLDGTVHVFLLHQIIGVCWFLHANSASPDYGSYKWWGGTLDRAVGNEVGYLAAYQPAY
jgi:hypothetical protein